MLREGELDAAIYADLPNDPALKSLIPDPEAAAQKWYAQHKVVTEALARSRPDLVAEVFRLLAQSKKAAEGRRHRFPSPRA
jgi:4,5-dihydroxyphthalate decarboxylase